MRILSSSQAVQIPEGVSVKTRSRRVVVTGPRGNLVRSFRHLQGVEMTSSTNGKSIQVKIWFGNRKELACIRTVCSHIKNMIVGVTKGFIYKMRFVYAHFPINVTLGEKEEWIEIRNFLGEKQVRRVEMPEGVKIIRTTQKDEIALTGNNVEKVAQACARIHQSCLVRNKDIRKFLDGIYVSEKGVIPDEE